MSSAPVHVLQVRIALKTPAGRAAFRAALEQVCADDVFGFQIGPVDSDNVTAILEGPGASQLVDAINRLADLGADCAAGALEIAYRETISRVAEHDHVHKTLIGQTGKFARMILRLEPLARGE